MTLVAASHQHLWSPFSFAVPQKLLIAPAAGGVVADVFEHHVHACPFSFGDITVAIINHFKLVEDKYRSLRENSTFVSFESFTICVNMVEASKLSEAFALGPNRTRFYVLPLAETFRVRYFGLILVKAICVGHTQKCGRNEQNGIFLHNLGVI